MAYDEGLAQRLRNQFRQRNDVVEKNMFGGLCFMMSDHMCCGIVGDRLIVRVGPAAYEECLRHENAGEMDFTGKPMKGLVYVARTGTEADTDLAYWVALATRFVSSLPPKKPRRGSKPHPEPHRSHKQ